MPRFTVFLFLLLLLLFHSGEIGAVDNGEKFVHPSHKMKLRKLMEEVSLHDYDYGGPNPKHDPRKGKPPGPNRNR